MAPVTRNPLKLLQVCLSDIHVAAAWAQKNMRVNACLVMFLECASCYQHSCCGTYKPPLATSGSHVSVSEPEITGMHGNARAATHVAPVVAPAYCHNMS